MDIFDQYLFEELTTQYSKSDLSDDEYEELYMRFCNIDHLEEVQPYLLTMRYFGLGTAPEKKAVLSELKEKLSENNCLLNGLYYDLLLTEDDNNTDALMNLHRMAEEGYTDVFTKEKTNVGKATASVIDLSSVASSTESEIIEEVVVDYITFECRDYSGLCFAAGEIDYLSAKVYIKPLHGKKHIKVRSQIFLDDDTFSKVFSNEYDIDSNTRWFKTQGWGNKNYTCYEDNTYKWVIEIDGKTTFSQKFRMYYGKINKTGPKVKDIKLFASKAKSLEKDRYTYKSTFDGSTLEYVYFKFLIDPLYEYMNVQMFLKVTYLEDGSVFWDRCFLHELKENWNEFWRGIGYSSPGKWKRGLYQYSVYVGNGPKFEGTFTVY